MRSKDEVINETMLLAILDRISIEEANEILTEVHWCLKVEGMSSEDILRALKRETKLKEVHRVMKPGGRPSKVRKYARRIKVFRKEGDTLEFRGECLKAYFDLSRSSFWRLRQELKEDVPELQDLINSYMK
jgi:hypothetical protein